MQQIKGQLRRRGITACGVDLQTAQDDFLKPRRNGRIERARRHGVAPDAPFQPLQPLRIAKGTHACREKIHQNAQRKLVAARLMPYAQHLLRRHIGRGAIGQAEFLHHQVRQLVVMREAIINQHHLAIGAEQHIGRLEIKVDHMLAVKIMQRRGNFCAQCRNIGAGHRQVFKSGQQRGRVDMLHHQIGLGGKIPHSHIFGHMNALEARQNHLLHLEADNGRRVFALMDHRHFHQHRHVYIRPRHLPQGGHAALIDEFDNFKTADGCARFKPVFGHLSPLPQAFSQ